MTIHINALDAPISAINAAIAVAQDADPKNPVASYEAGIKLIKSTKASLKAVKDIAGVSSPQYQMVADNIAQQILQCGINYYIGTTDYDVEKRRKALELQLYAWSIAVGQNAKKRCKKNYDILKQGVDNMPPAEVAIEVYKITEELRLFRLLPDKISYSVTLINNTKPLLQTIKSKLGATNPIYLSLSTQIVDNALHKVIAEVNKAQDTFTRTADEYKRRGLYKIYESLDTTTDVTTPQPTTPHKSSSDRVSNSEYGGWPVSWIITIIVSAIGAITYGGTGFFCGAIIGLGAIIIRNHKN